MDVFGSYVVYTFLAYRWYKDHLLCISCSLLNFVQLLHLPLSVPVQATASTKMLTHKGVRQRLSQTDP